MSVLLETNLQDTLISKGKVRDIYDLDDKLLIVVTDRLSAFDVVMPDGIPDKGAVLNLLSAFWFEKTAYMIPNHVVQVVEESGQLNSYNSNNIYPSSLAGRSMVVKKAERFPVECVVRGYISGSAWSEYKKSGTINSIPYPKGLKESEKFPEPIFTPTTKADSGHDEPLTPDELNQLVGEPIAKELEEKTKAIYRFAEEYARTRGIIIADTKMEFCMLDNKIILIDELLTPDSSRFWDVSTYEAGHSQPSFDKQIVRDWLNTTDWDKTPPGPKLPEELIKKTSEKYQEVYQILTGKPLPKY